VSQSHPVFFSKELDRHYKGLGKNLKQRRWINDMAQVLSKNPFAGNLIRKKQIPQYYRTKYQVQTLFRYRLPEGHRSTYTFVTEGKDAPFILIFDIMNHKKYDNRFGYKGS
jgi:hypothetical protein